MIDERLILLNLHAENPEAVIRALGIRLEEAGYVKPSWAEAVLAREKIYATGLPTEAPVGLPHTDVEHCLRPAIAVATLAQPVPWGRMGDPTQTVSVQTVFALSIVQPQEQVKTLTKLIDFCQQPETLQTLQAAPSVERAAQLLRERLGEPSASPRATPGAGQPSAPARTSITLTVRHASGLHARPAAQFVKMAAAFPCTITVRNISSHKPAANAKSVLSVLTQGVSQGHEVELTATGDRAEAALAALKELIESNFGEA